MLVTELVAWNLGAVSVEHPPSFLKIRVIAGDIRKYRALVEPLAEPFKPILISRAMEDLHPSHEHRNLGVGISKGE